MLLPRASSVRCQRKGTSFLQNPHEVYASEHYRRVLLEEGIACSMSSGGQCWDNAPMSSFFGRLKCEVVAGEMFATRDQARAELFDYLEVFYNRVQWHSSLGFLSRVEFERTYN